MPLWLADDRWLLTQYMVQDRSKPTICHLHICSSRQCTDGCQLLWVSLLLLQLPSAGGAAAAAAGQGASQAFRPFPARTIALPCASRRELPEAEAAGGRAGAAAAAAADPLRVRHYLVKTKTGRCVVSINTLAEAAAAGGRAWLRGGRQLAPRVSFSMPLTAFAPEYEKFCMQNDLQTKDVSGWPAATMCGRSVCCVDCRILPCAVMGATGSCVASLGATEVEPLCQLLCHMACNDVRGRNSSPNMLNALQQQLSACWFGGDVNHVLAPTDLLPCAAPPHPTPYLPPSGAGLLGRAGQGLHQPQEARGGRGQGPQAEASQHRQPGGEAVWKNSKGCSSGAAVVHDDWRGCLPNCLAV